MERRKTGEAPILVPGDVLNGLNILRQIGAYNMFDVPAVVTMARELGLVDTGEWIEANRTAYAKGLLHGFEAEQDFWSARLSDFEDCRCGCGGKRRCQEGDEHD
jgi:hypothetical protein